MLKGSVKRKFLPHGAQAAFRRFAASRGHHVSHVMVLKWLRGEATSAPLDLLASEWPGMNRRTNGSSSPLIARR